MKKIASGNEAIALGALSAGVKVISGYPGTPSSEVIGSLWQKELTGTHVEWSVNEKVAVEIAAAAGWAGQRSLCTMKMSGLNVAYDSLIGFAYSGTNGGMVVYVADDPGVTTGMCEQDSRGFAIMSDMVMLEPATVQECYDYTKFAFELSEAIGAPVFLRGVTNVSQSHALLEYEERLLPVEKEPILKKDIAKYTKAGSAICTAQHKALISSFAEAEKIIRVKGLNELKLGKKGGIGIIAAGVSKQYLTEALVLANREGAAIAEENISTLKLAATLPFPVQELQAILQNCSVVIVAEELEPHLEREVYHLAYKLGMDTKIIGKMDGTYSRLGEYNAGIIAQGLFAATGKAVPAVLKGGITAGMELAAARPITTCSGCPHRGTYMAINAAIKHLGYKKDEIMVTGDIGCTILGMNPPFHTLWTEVSMGASIPIAQGYIQAGVTKPVLATIGDSTFFHAGIPGLINAIQQNVDLTVVILDNGWTAMTGMQVNPGTLQDYQKDPCQQVDLVKVVQGLGVEQLWLTDPYDLAATTKIMQEAIDTKGVKVVIARRECAIQATRRKVDYGKVQVIQEKCTNCKVCVNITGCPALVLAENSVYIDDSQCNGCGLCAQVCKFNAIQKEAK